MIGAADNCTEMVAEERALNEIQAVTQAIAAGTNSAELDYTRDGQVTAADRDYLLHFVLNTKRGDANLDGYFASDDLVTVFQYGQYEDTVAGNSTWVSGDWDGNGDFTSADLVAAFSEGYDVTTAAALNADSPTATVRAVPEPTGMSAFWGAVALFSWTHRRRRCQRPRRWGSR